MRKHNATPTDDEARLLARRAGSTPVYVYSREGLREAAARVRKASAPGAGLYYSLKANPHPGVVTALVALVDGFDVCSLRELETALNAGTDPRRVLFTGPAKSAEEATAALAAGVMVTVESPAQAGLFAKAAAGLGVTGRAVIRLNTPYPGRTSQAEPMRNQFGVADHDVAEVVDVLRASALEITGLQLFWGSQYADAEVIRAARRSMVAKARDCVDRFGLRVDFVSVGGGIAMPWCDKDPEVDWAGLAETGTTDADTDTDSDSDTGDDGFPLVCEYGRSIAGPAGSLLTQVLDTKIVDGRRYVLVDAGINHMFIAGRLIAGGDRGEPRVRAVGARPGAETSPAWITGPLCSQLDVLAEGVELPEVQVGDLLIFEGVGAYGRTFSPGGFLSRDQVREIVF